MIKARAANPQKNIKSPLKNIQNSANTAQKSPLKVKDIRQFYTKPLVSNSVNSINETLANFQHMVFDMLPNLNGKQKDVLATAIPYMHGLVGDFVANQSSVSLTTFKKMAYTDPIIANGLSISSELVAQSIGDYYHDNPKIQKLIRYNLMHLKGGFRGLIKDMLTADWAGFFVGEKVVNREKLESRGEYLISEVIPLPPISVAFAVDEAGSVRERNGIFQQIINPRLNESRLTESGLGEYGFRESRLRESNGSFGGDPLASFGDLDYPERVMFMQLFGLIEIPKDKCIHYINRSIDNFNSPCGRSSLRRIYNIYLLKYGVQQFMAMALQFRAFPQMVVYTDGQQQIEDDNGNVVTNYDVGLKLAEQREGTGTFVLPGMKGTSFDVQAVDVTGDLQVFIQILQFYDQEIYKGLGIPPSLFDNSSGGSYAMGYVHDSLLNKMLNGKREDVINCILNQFVADIIDKNFNEDEYENFGGFKERTLTLDDKLKYAKLFETARNSGICSTKLMEDLNHMREILDFGHTDKEVPQDIVDNALNTKQTNLRETKQDINTPYSNW